MTPKVLLCFIQYGPYHFARLSSAKGYLAQSYTLEGWELSAEQSIYSWQRHQNETSLVHSASGKSLEKTPFFLWPLRVWQSLSKLQPDALFLAGYSHIGIFSALIWAKFHRKRVFLMSDTKENDAPRHPLKEQIKSWIISLFDGAITAGSSSSDYLHKHGLAASQSQIFTPYDVIDNESFQRPAPNHKTPASTSSPYFLCISRFIPRKNILGLLDAYTQYLEQCHHQGLEPYTLTLCGDGPEQDKIEQRISELNLDQKVHLLGFLQTEDLKPILWESQAIIQPSTVDMWVLTINEAMAAEVPCLVSQECGCVPELAEPHVTAWTFDPYSKENMAQTLLAFHLTSNDERQKRVQSAKQRVEDVYSLTNFAKAMESCLTQNP